MNETAPHDVLDAAARAIINQRCARAYLHDVRGSMQALFSAVELLGRSVVSKEVDCARAEKAWDLARRAISHHEKSTLDVLQLLSLQHTDTTEFDAAVLIEHVVRLLRNEAASKGVRLVIAHTTQALVLAERPQLQTVFAGLITAALDETPSGEMLPISVERHSGMVIISIGCSPTEEPSLEAALAHQSTGSSDEPQPSLDSRQLTLSFARHYLTANKGRLEIHAQETPRGIMRVHYPSIASPPI